MTIVDEGNYNGSSVNLPDLGGQWASNFTKPELDLQVSGPTAEDVRIGMAALVKESKAQLLTVQQDLSVAKPNLVTARLDPGTIPIYYQDGSRKRSVAGAIILGVWGTIVLAVVVDRRRQRRRRHAPAPGALQPAGSV